jgi:hypothetical protein
MRALLLGLALPLLGQEAEAVSFHGQSTLVVQGHGAFNSPDAGPNSFQDRKEVRTSFTGTLFLGLRTWSGGEVYANAEAAGGQGVSEVLGLAGELVLEDWTLCAGSFLEPRVANMLDFDHQVSRAHGELVEVQHDHGSGKVHLLLFENHARMGNYREALAADPAAPDVTASRSPGRRKSGWAVDLEQSLTEDLGAFARYSRDDGRTETWAFTEVDRSLSAGLQLAGTAWGRKADRVGLAFVDNGLSPDHADYLRAGGLGFLLGDGRLNEGSERILEAYYAAAFGSHLTFSLDAQRIENPGYNRDRGPVSVYAARIHLAF